MRGAGERCSHATLKVAFGSVDCYASAEVQLYERSELACRPGLLRLDATSLGLQWTMGYLGSHGGARGGTAVGQMHPRAESSCWTRLARWEPPTVGDPWRAAVVGLRDATEDDGGCCKELRDEASGSAKVVQRDRLDERFLDLTATSTDTMARRNGAGARLAPSRVWTA